MVYEYYEKGRMRTSTILTVTPPSDQWQQVFAYYRPNEDGLKSAASAIVVAEGQTVDVDDVRVEGVSAASDLAGLEAVVLENELVREVRQTGGAGVCVVTYQFPNLVERHHAEGS